MEVILAFLAGLVLGCVVGFFVYRNNEKRIDPLADRVDAFYARVNADLLPHLSAKARAEIQDLMAKLK